MALVTRRYRRVSTTDARAQQFVAPSATVVTQLVNVIDLQVNDAVGGTTETLDEYMNTLGYVYDPAALSGMAGKVGIGSWIWWLTAGANVTIQMNLVSATYREIIMPRNGYLLAMTSYSSVDIPSGGVVTFRPKKATPTGVLADMAGADWTMDSVTWPRARIFDYAPGAQTFLSGEKFGIEIATNASATASSTYSVQMEVAYT